MIKLLDILKEVQSSQYKIYCDMDGVLADFNKGYKDLTGITPPGPNAPNNDPEKFWEPLKKAGKDFWVNLEWMPDGKELWKYIEKYKPTILSAPSREISSREGKTEWINNHLPGVSLKFKAAKNKKDFAKPNAILIDDREDTIQSWNDKGGIGIHHTSAADTIKQLKDLGL